MNSTIPNKLHHRLLELPFDAYLRLLGMLLSRLGYRDITLAGRTDWKGRNRAGGYDLLATLSSGLYPRRVVIQAKQFGTTARVFQRQADELRGVAIRAGATEALLITSGPLSRSIDQEALALPLAPVRLIGGDQLLELLIQHKVGILPNGQLDEDLFQHLERTATGNRPIDCLGANNELVLTVAVKRIPKGVALACR